MKNTFTKICLIVIILIFSLIFITKWLEGKLKAPENVVILNIVEREFESDPVISDWIKIEKKYSGVKWIFLVDEIHGILQFEKETKIPDNVSKRLAIISSKNSKDNLSIKFDITVVGD